MIAQNSAYRQQNSIIHIQKYTDVFPTTTLIVRSTFAGCARKSGHGGCMRIFPACAFTADAYGASV